VATESNRPDELTFEAALSRLEQVVRELESGELDLERSLALFQEGVALTRRCSRELTEAEGKIEQLLAGGVTVPLTDR
jgi:exodeoxyribonuclease VII small subunit